MTIGGTLAGIAESIKQVSEMSEPGLQCTVLSRVKTRSEILHRGGGGALGNVKRVASAVGEESIAISMVHKFLPE